jgi:hypothetical protein
MRCRILSEYQYGSDCCYSLNPDSHEALRRMCTDAAGNFNAQMFGAYFELAAWSATLWLIGPPGREFRMANHDIFSAALTFGEAVMVEGSVIDPGYYRKLSRAPMSCVVCGLAAWCVEMVSSAHTARYMCEHCLSQGMPPSAMATCGGKRCLLAACAHHPYHSLGTVGIHQARKEYGQLKAVAGSRSALRAKIGPEISKRPLLPW